MSNSHLIAPNLRVVAWEVTRKCNLSCLHCRASAENEDYEGELSTQECRNLVEQIAGTGKPILILSGGEPLLRNDLLDIAAHAVKAGLRVALGTNGTLITEEFARKAKEVPISRVGVSLDFPSAGLQDHFRGRSGSYEAMLKGIEACRKAGLEVQINSTITALNAHLMEDLLQLSLDLGAVAFHPFLLVPTGRGKGLREHDITPAQCESLLLWIFEKSKEFEGKIFIKPTDAPHYFRVVSQHHGSGSSGGGHPHGPLDGFSRGCLAGTGFCFISHRGRVQGCGYFDVEAGDLRKNSFAEVWQDSPVFNRLRDLSNLKGKCGACEFKRVCGGCRARAYETTGDWLASDPYCVYEPGASRAGKVHGTG